MIAPILKGGVFMGRVLVSQSSKVGGSKGVFVHLNGLNNELVFPFAGGQVKNPYKGVGKVWAGDLMEYRTDANGENPEVYILKTYEVESVDTANKVVNIVRDGYHSIPYAGDVIMAAPATLATAGTGSTVVKVEKGKVGTVAVWKLTLSAAIDAQKGAVLVECDENGKMYVQNVNAVAPCDYDFAFGEVGDPVADEDDAEAGYYITPALGGLMYSSKMSVLPQCVKDKNESKVNGWFKIGSWGNF